MQHRYNLSLQRVYSPGLMSSASIFVFMEYQCQWQSCVTLRGSESGRTSFADARSFSGPGAPHRSEPAVPYIPLVDINIVMERVFEFRLYTDHELTGGRPRSWSDNASVTHGETSRAS
jgi:hypothetical protein